MDAVQWILVIAAPFSFALPWLVGVVGLRRVLASMAPADPDRARTEQTGGMVLISAALTPPLGGVLALAASAPEWGLAWAGGTALAATLLISARIGTLVKRPRSSRG
ncbi:hypothetical protein [Streptomyces sp. G-5]|uniref:hypothetical protein n=1 Tax=Streptomyces sp. G-5 TaxID=2977231 RepID=UPI0021D2972E|nr:hypothetical protein [Streptomyces sp. G-5]MCU4750227.1 hypothetical protein [Streptomyces sp. G-5]